VPLGVRRPCVGKPVFVLAIVCPGQGAQTPGGLTPWLDLPRSADALAAYSEAAEVDLLRHGTVSDAETIRDTAVAQPLIVASGLLALGALFDRAPQIEPRAVGALAGHSVGEITATVAAGVLTPGEAMTFVAVRGRAMAAASAVTPTGMAAVVGGDGGEVAAKLAGAGLTAANLNGGGQVVAAGTLAQLDALEADPPARARIIRLSVAGAFHTQHMAPAAVELATVAARLAPADPVTVLISNADGAVVKNGSAMLTRLVNQVSNPVRWDLCTTTLADLGVRALIELPPAGTLAGLAKRALKGVDIVALKTPDDLDAARALVSAHTTATTAPGDAA